MVCQGLVEILAAHAIAIRWKLINLSLSIVLRCAMLLQFTGHAKYGQVLIHKMEVAGLNLFEHIIPHLTNETIVIFTFDVDYELFISLFSALRQGHNLLESNGSLES